MTVTTIKLKNEDDYSAICQVMRRYPFDIDLSRGRYIVDAKSILGILALGSMQEEIEVNAHTDNISDVESLCYELTPWRVIQRA